MKERILPITKQLLRYDIPFLYVGLSSIGKSYSIIEMAESHKINYQILYIGSEKSEYIEGYPDLANSKDGNLSYLKPFWFPNDVEISKQVKNGRDIYKMLIKESGLDEKKDANIVTSYNTFNFFFEYIKFIDFGIEEKYILSTTENDFNLPEYNKLHSSLKNLDLELSKSDIIDLANYCSTILGYGNYWVILDELDKVTEEQHDKYAPLLHIVRERRLKSYVMRKINNNRGIQPYKHANRTSYQYNYKIVESEIESGNYENGSLIDSRIIGISNATDNIEEALFRRFIQLIVDEKLIYRKDKIDSSKDYFNKKVEEYELKAGISLFDKNKELVAEKVQFLDDVNLYWTYHVLPTLLNEKDEPNLIKNDLIMFLSNYGENFSVDDFLAGSLIGKIIDNNFSEKSVKALLKNVILDRIKNVGLDIATPKEEEEVSSDIESITSEDAEIIDELKDKLGSDDDKEFALNIQNYFEEEVRNNAKSNTLTQAIISDVFRQMELLTYSVSSDRPVLATYIYVVAQYVQHVVMNNLTGQQVNLYTLPSIYLNRIAQHLSGINFSEEDYKEIQYISSRRVEDVLGKKYGEILAFYEFKLDSSTGKLDLTGIDQMDKKELMKEIKRIGRYRITSLNKYFNKIYLEDYSVTSAKFNMISDKNYKTRLRDEFENWVKSLAANDCSKIGVDVVKKSCYNAKKVVEQIG
jgi:hypothetical protein